MLKEYVKTAHALGVDPRTAGPAEAAGVLAVMKQSVAPPSGGDDSRAAWLSALQKATIDTGVAANGMLPPEKSKAFTQIIKERSVLGPRMRLERRQASSGEIDKLTSGRRLMRRATENADDGYRAEVQFPTVPYATTKIRLPWEVTEDVYHENIEGEGLEAKITDEMTQQFGLDWEDLNINGDEGDSDPFVQLDDGLLVLAEDNLASSHRINAGATFTNSHMEKDKFFAALKKMPNKYVQQGNLIFIGSPIQHIEWLEYLTNRNTAAGDAALLGQGESGSKPLNIEFLPVPSFPDDRLILTTPNNLVRIVTWDVQYYRVTPNTDWELATRHKRGYIYFFSQDFIVDEYDAMVDVYGLTTTP